ncbi:MAG: hypothetical protein WCE75_07160 [Terracidiphilus sp.]
MTIHNHFACTATRRSFLRGGASALAAGILAPLSSLPSAAGQPAPPPHAGRRFHLSAQGNDGASGLSPRTPWKTLERVNRASFEPGDAILLRSGDHFRGQLRPQGSGAENRPILLSRYGTGRLPIVDMGAAKGPAIRLEDQCWWQICELEVTSGEPAEPGTGRQGIAALALTPGRTHNIAIHDCYLHDIWGTLLGSGPYDQYNSAAIYVGAPMQDNQVTASAHNILVDANRIERVDRCGIIALACKTGLVVRQNRLENLGGDAIVPIGCDGALVERNVAHRSCLRTGDPVIWTPEILSTHKDDNPHSAAIWLADCTGGVMQFNEVYDTGRAAGNGDGEGYDIDLDCRDCILQYNFSSNNHGMFLIMQRTKGNVARYNISQNDQTHILALRPDLGDMNLIHNNVFYVDYGTAVIEMRDDERERKDTTKVGVPLRNNIFYATGEGRFQVTYADPTVPDPSPGANRLFLDNCYFGPWLGDGPNDSSRAANTYDPLFVAPGQGGYGLDSLKGYQLQPGSPCIGRGIAIPNNGGRDFWGNPLPAGRLDIGAFQHRS